MQTYYYYDNFAQKLREEFDKLITTNFVYDSDHTKLMSSGTT